MASGSRPYQGYPYTNPHVIDAPSVDAATASRWANLPRKQIYPKAPARESIEPVVYVDIPDDEEACEARVFQAIEPAPSQNTQPPDKKDKEIDEPVIYIDLPSSSASDVAQPASPPPDTAETSYVQETIFYDPFENRRIDPKLVSECSDSEGSCSAPRSPASPRPRPAPPSTLNIASPGSSGYGSSSGLPSFMSKESQVYGRQPTPDDGFSLTPLPVEEYREPPPAYSEIDLRSPTLTAPSPAQTAQSSSEPPRTIVITEASLAAGGADGASPLGLASADRKVVLCPHCGQRVHTLVIRQTGLVTHVLGMSFLVCGLFPLTFLVYCTDFAKNKNHYCPNCNRLIGSEVPLLCQKFTEVT